MKVQDILFSGEKILVESQQARWKPGGKEIYPGKLAVTDQRLILETSSFMGLKHDYQSFTYADIMEVELKKNVFSSDVIVQSRFKGQIHLNSINHNKAKMMEQILNQKISEYRFGALTRRC